MSPTLDPRGVAEVRRLLAAVLGTVTGPAPESTRLSARLAGVPYEGERVELFRTLAGTLRDSAPIVRPALGVLERWAWLPFLDAHFSNFIEGTEFDVEEARRIALEGEIPAERPADAHDVAATFRIASDVRELRRRPRTFEELRPCSSIGTVCSWPHGRRRTREGSKTRDNWFGGYRFVAHDHVPGTLRHGLELVQQQRDPFHRAV